MLKLGSRSRKRWHDRYFVFRADNTLRYYHRKGESKPKAVYELTGLEDAVVSDLFVDRHHKKLIYCVRLTWSSKNNNNNDTKHDSFVMEDDSSSIVLSDDGPYVVPHNSSGRSSDAGRSVFRKRKSARASGKVVQTRSVDAESLTQGEPILRTPDSKKRKDGKVEVPSLVEVDQRYSPTQAVRTASPKQSDEDAKQQRNLTPYEEEREEEQNYLHSQYRTARQASKKKSQQKFLQGTKLAVAATVATVGVAVATAGIGLAVGVVVIGAAAAGAGSTAVGSFRKKKEGEIVIACEDYEVAKAWKSCFDAAVESAMVKTSKWGQLFTAEGKLPRLALFPTNRCFESSGASPRSQEQKIDFENSSRWRPLEGGWATFLGAGGQGLRIFREEREDENGSPDPNSLTTNLSVAGKPCAPCKARVTLNTSALNAFMCLMSYGNAPPSMSEVPPLDSYRRTSFRIVESIDDNTDVIHLVTRPLYLFPSAVAPRDFVLFRYWRIEPDGKYVICYESMDHEECPPLPNYVRAEMHQVITIAPPKKRLGQRAVNQIECLMTAVVQVDPRGWVPTMRLSMLSNQSYGDAFGVSALLQLLEIRDAIDVDRFVPNHVLAESQQILNAQSGITRTDSVEGTERHDDYANYDFAYAAYELGVSRTRSGLSTTPPPLELAKWAAPNPSSYRIRGKFYKEDGRKFNAGPSIGRLVAVDVVAVDKPLYGGLTTHPTERVQLALEREANLKAKGMESDMPPFIFVVSIVLPGPPVYQAGFYYAVDDMSTIDGTDGSPSSMLCKEFLFGDSDEFRDRTFKLIPQIVQGNFMVRKAVGSTPAIIGKKLRQLYVRSDRFCEVIMDCCSSAVAAGIIRLSLSYAKTLVVDMAFLFEADDPSTLPERIFGCARVKNMAFGPHLRFVQAPAEHTMNDEGAGDGREA